MLCPCWGGCPAAAGDSHPDGQLAAPAPVPAVLAPKHPAPVQERFPAARLQAPASAPPPAVSEAAAVKPEISTHQGVTVLANAEATKVHHCHSCYQCRVCNPPILRRMACREVGRPYKGDCLAAMVSNLSNRGRHQPPTQSQQCAESKQAVQRGRPCRHDAKVVQQRLLLDQSCAFSCPLMPC